jgi:hypothetical protein
VGGCAERGCVGTSKTNGCNAMFPQSLQQLRLTTSGREMAGLLPGGQAGFPVKRGFIPPILSTHTAGGAGFRLCDSPAL